MNRFELWQRWLVAVGLAMVAFGIVMTFLNGTALFDVFNEQIDPVFWGTATLPDGARVFQRWVYGAWGATVAGLGVLVACVAHYPFKKGEAWSRNCLVVGMGVWYVLDTGVSIWFGVYFNALFNTALLALMAIPLALTWGAFASGSGPVERAGAQPPRE
ncbi:MAG: hypothetical protein E3J64_02330 [Anaerolineales bacterium]|nr:MAG: hypothetical protein E3J64_02330 [Anaerolineales bacterium]